jgi:hypothetical protein
VDLAFRHRQAGRVSVEITSKQGRLDVILPP